MQIRYDPEADVLTLVLRDSDAHVEETVMVSPEVFVLMGFDALPVEIHLINASLFVNNPQEAKMLPPPSPEESKEVFDRLIVDAERTARCRRDD